MTTDSSAQAIDLTELVGTSSSLDHTVTPQDSAKNWGNELDVLATPVLLWLGEIAAMKVIEKAITDADMTVGLAHDSAHLAPTPTGETVTLTATLTRVEGKKLTFAVEGRDTHSTVLRGEHTRAVVDRDRFTAKLASRTA